MPTYQTSDEEREKERDGGKKEIRKQLFDHFHVLLPTY